MKNVTTNQMVIVVNQDASKATRRLSSLQQLAKKHYIKLMVCPAADLDCTLRGVLQNKKIRRIIIGGGDGTVTTAASLIQRMRPAVELAVLPLGTANYYLKSLGASRNLAKAFEVALNGTAEKRHLCRANNRDFLLGVNVGATSKMFAQVTNEEKGRFGRMAYFRGVFRLLLQAVPPDITITAHGKTYEYIGTELVVLNQKLHGPIKLLPDVHGTEPHFEIITYGLGRNKLSPAFAVLMFAVTFGRNQKYLKRIKATKARIVTKDEQPVAIDGDSLEKTPVNVELVDEPVTFIRA